MPKVPQAHLDRRRDQILTAARACFNDKGFHRTTMKDITAASRLSAGAVYNYFKSKEDIIVALAEKIGATAIQASALVNLGTLQRRRGESVDAVRETYDQAIRLAEVHDNPDLAFNALTNLARLEIDEQQGSVGGSNAGPLQFRR